MKIYLLERMRLRDLARIKTCPPEHGDIVVFLRDAQAFPDDRAYYMKRGISCFNGETLLSHKDAKRIDTFFFRFYAEWLEGGRVLEKNSETALIAKSIATFFSLGNKLTIVLRRAEILRKLFARHDNCREIVTDIKDGLSYFDNLLGENISMPQRTAIDEVTKQHGVKVMDITVSAPLPLSHNTSSGMKYRMLFRYFLGGWRPRYLINRLYWRFKKKEKDRVYIFNNHGLALIADSIFQKGKYDVFTDRDSDSGTVGIRHDHIFPIPSFGLLFAAFRFGQTAKGTEDSLKETGAAVYNGFDYGPVFAKAISKTIDYLLPYVVIKISQSKALIEKYKIDMVVINGEIPQMLATSDACKKAIYIDHGLNVFDNGPPCNFGCQEDLVYIACGQDHLSNFGRGMEEDKKPRTVVLSSPGLPIMNPIKGRRRNDRKNKILLGNFSPNFDTTAAKYFKNDQYMIDLFSAVKLLGHEGMTFTYRRHPAENPSYSEFIAKELNIGDFLTIDNSGAFSDALAEHGAFVANATSCIYQSLYAGWPTIFYEPQFHVDDFIGLPAATDFTPPVARTVEQLVELIRATQDSESRISNFPSKFNSKYAKRFIGPDPSKADHRIADFIASEIE